MSQKSEQYMYFTVGLLKDSFALEELWKDAVKYHMVDQPGKLVAMRLTEYYEMKSQTGNLTSNNVSIAPTNNTPLIGEREPGLTASSANTISSDQIDSVSIMVASAEAEQNAEEAADYWTIL
jgi:hypothetical protein